MKKIYLMALSVFAGAAAMAQVSVTFQVDMNGETVSPNGVHVAGNWQEEAGFPADWQPGTSMMTDDDADGIYTLTVTIPAGQYEFKYLNGNDWPFEEGIPVVSQKGGGNSNRFFAVTDWHGTVSAENPTGEFMLPAIEFGGSAPAGKVAVRLQIDMANQTVAPEGVHVAGSAITPNWTPQYGTATESSNNKYAYVTNVDPDGTYDYKFLTGDFWGTDESVPDDCGAGSNRQVTVTTEDVITEALCFGTCETCAPVTEVTFSVDMSNVCGLSAEGAYIAGSFNGFTGEPMDDQGNGVYSVTLSLDAGTYDFKFQNGPGGWEGNLQGDCAVEGGGNREVVIDEPGVAISYGPFCFGSCDAVCSDVPDPADITFRVDMNAETISADGVFLIGNFTDPNWQDGAIALEDADNDGIYEFTTEICQGSFEYKFVNGDVFNAENDEFFGNEDQLPCNIPSGNGGWNRVHTRIGGAEIFPVVPFNACAPLSVTEVELGNVAIFPNPTEGNTFMEIENPNGYTLRVEVLDITGKSVIANNLINSNRYELNTSALSPGLYFLNVTNEKSERASYKLMVQ